MNEPRHQGSGSGGTGGGNRGGRGRKSRGGRGGKRGGQNRPKPEGAPNPQQGGGQSAGGSPTSHGGKKKNNRNRRRRGKRGDGSSDTPAKPMGKVIEYIEPKRHGVLFFDTHAQAKNNLEKIAAKAQEVDILNIVIKAEGPMNDPEILAHGRMFAGEAWHLIHTRRQEEGWYDGPQPRQSEPSQSQPSA